MQNKTAREYWKQRFDEYPQSDSDKLSVAMMSEYFQYRKEESDTSYQKLKDAFEEMLNKQSRLPEIQTFWRTKAGLP